ncbi:peptidoglycan-binding protein [Dactylosporangium sp. NPDC051484]|uniref:peptidoglycan-binding protein n=1 Tax=Dactylosporangium sp. NPDC051484 TaxID=3154942 RepID=UPI00344F255C
MTSPDDAAQAHRRRRGRSGWIAAAVVAALAIVGGGAAIAAAALAEPPAPRKHLTAGEAPIERGTLSGSVKASGTLAYADPHDVGSTLSGVLTAAPRPGVTVGVGQPLFSVDNVPVFLFHGSLPAWRSFRSGMDDGPDIQQLEENLKTLGFFNGKPDRKFTGSTTSAILAWQKATGQERTGRVDLGRIVFDQGDVRVQSVKTQRGGAVGAGAAVLSVTELQKRVSVKLQLANQQLAKVGGAVRITLPDGTRTTGKVLSVGTPQQEGGDKENVVIPVVVTLDDPAAGGDLQQAVVTVSFPAQIREHVLSVPVSALIALDDQHFGVEVVRSDGTVDLVPVATGLFAGGRVEISGNGLEAGQHVVVPKI